MPTIENLSLDNIVAEYQKQFNETIASDEVRQIVNSPVILQYSNTLQKSNPRLHNQKGTFLICGNELNGDTVTGKLKSLDTYVPVLVIRIPFEYKKAIKEELDNRYKINQMSIYPELPSVAQYIKAKYGKEGKRQISPHRIRKALANFSPGKGQKILCFADHWSVPGQ